jgi:hypothetical protein
MSLTYVKGKIVTPKFNENKYTLGSGVGRTSTSNRRALQRRAAHKNCCTYSGIISKDAAVQK